MPVFINTSLTTAGNISGDTFIFNNNDQYFVRSTGGNIDHNTIIFGDGRGDVVRTDASVKNIEFNTIIFGDGANDLVNSQLGIVQNNTITFGDGNSDAVVALYSVNNNTITFGNGNNDSVFATTLDVSGNKITFGSGAGDHVSASNRMENNIITFGGGDGDKVAVITGPINNNIITFGDGIGDSLTVQTLGGDNNVITFGNGDNATITLGFPSEVGFGSSNNVIVVGNGNNDTIALGANTGGNNTIITGTGFNVKVEVGQHSIADTFGFSLGTDGSAFTTVSGAKAGDFVIAGTSLGNNLVDLQGTDETTLAGFINSLGRLQDNNTYVGYNTDTNNTYVVTVSGSVIGAVDIVGVFDSNTIANHVLTLGGNLFAVDAEEPPPVRVAVNAEQPLIGVPVEDIGTIIAGSRINF